MDFLSAIGSLLLVLLLGCGSLIVAYFAWTEYQASGSSFWRRPGLPGLPQIALTWDQIRNRAMVAFVLLCAGGVLALAISNRSLDGAQGDQGVAGPQGPAGPAGTAIRTIESTSCAKDGCPVTCQADETLVAAFCISRTGARLTDTLIVDKGLLRAQCSGGYSRIVVTCTPTRQ